MDDEGVPFWGGSRRVPTPLAFSPTDLAHRAYVLGAAALRGRGCGQGELRGPDTPALLRAYDALAPAHAHAAAVAAAAAAAAAPPGLCVVTTACSPYPPHSTHSPHPLILNVPPPSVTRLAWSASGLVWQRPRGARRRRPWRRRCCACPPPPPRASSHRYPYLAPT